MNSKWDQTELTLVDELNTHLPVEYTAIRTGGSDSTQPDIAVHKNGTLHVNAEVKLLPSVAGIQTVITTNIHNEFTTTQKYPYSPHMLLITQSFPEAHGTKPQLLPKELHTIGYEALEQKYSHTNTRYLIGDTGTNNPNRYIICETSIEDLQKHLTLSFIVRKKKSGSSPLPTKMRTEIEQFLTTQQVNIHYVNNRLHVMNLNLIPAIQAELNEYGDNLFINKTGEIRKLGSTNNLTALLSLGLNPAIDNNDLLTGKQIADIIAIK